MSKQKFSLSSNFVKVGPEKEMQPSNNPIPLKKDGNRYTGPNTNRVHYSTSIDASLKNEFKIWVAQKGSDMSTELEKAIRLLIKNN
jgi:hypothetical protein